MKTEILAVMFTDIAGFTQRTSSQTYEENAQLLRQHTAIVHPLLKRFGGRVVKEMGDSVLAAFSSPTSAVRAAMAVQDRLTEINTDRHADEQLHLRIAINVGEVRIERDDLFGEGVNVAARLEAQTPVDEIYVSGAVYLTMNRTGIPMRFLGQRHLRGIEDPVTVFALPRHGNGETLPYGGHQLKYLARRQRRRTTRLACALAATLLVATLGGLFGWQRWTHHRTVKDAHTAIEAADYGRAAEELQLLAQSDLPNDALTKLLEVVEADPDAARACGALDLHAELLALDVGLRTKEAQLRLRHAYQLMRGGELAHARACLERVALAANTPESRILELSHIHLQALTALRARAVEELRQALEGYEEHLRVGSAPLEHLELMAHVAAESYAFAKTRPVADSLVLTLGEVAAKPLEQVALEHSTPSMARTWIVARLEKMAPPVSLRWTAIYAAQLDERSCSIRRKAISKIQESGQLGATGLLLREAAKRDSCTRSFAHAAVDYLVANGDAENLSLPAVEPVLVAIR